MALRKKSWIFLSFGTISDPALVFHPILAHIRSVDAFPVSVVFCVFLN